MPNTSSPSRLRNSGLRRSAGGAAAIASLGAALQTAHGEIIHSGVRNISTSSALGVDDVKPVQLSELSNKGADFSLMSEHSKGYDFHSLLDEGRFDHFAPVVSTEPSENGALQNLPAGELIDANSAFVTDGPLVVRLTNTTAGPWAGGSDGYFGYRFDTLGPTMLYGWGRITLSPDAQVMTLVEWAYENTGAPIRAGQLPEPGTGFLVALSLAIAALFRRRIIAARP
jgi:hypothetical protein